MVQRGPSGHTLGSATREGARGPFGDFSAMNKGSGNVNP